MLATTFLRGERAKRFVWFFSNLVLKKGIKEEDLILIIGFLYKVLRVLRSLLSPSFPAKNSGMAPETLVSLCLSFS